MTSAIQRPALTCLLLAGAHLGPELNLIGTPAAWLAWVPVTGHAEHRGSITERKLGLVEGLTRVGGERHSPPKGQLCSSPALSFGPWDFGTEVSTSPHSVSQL